MNTHKNILLVEDEVAMRFVMTHLLKRHGYHVHQAETGEQALEIWSEHHLAIDLLITDLSLPNGMNGTDMAARLRQESPDLQIIYISGHTREVALRKYPLIETESYLMKPFPTQQLEDLVMEKLGR